MNKDKSINAGDVVLSGKVVYSDDSISFLIETAMIAP
jgi:hypothetical protein